MAASTRTRAPRVCLACRALLLEGEACGCDAEAVAPASPVGWDQLVARVWGDVPCSARPSVRRSQESSQTAQIICALGAFTVITSLTFVFASDEPFAALTDPALWVIGVVMATFSTLTLQSFKPSSRSWGGERSRARGIAWPTHDVRGAVATAEGEATLTAPFSGERCLAWAIWIGSGDELLLRDARCAPHTLVFDGGDRVEMPEGRLDVAGTPRSAMRHPMKIADEFLLARRLHPPPALGDSDPREARHPFAGDWGYELYVRPGDRVVLANPITVESEDAASSYRHPLRRRRVPAGIPILALER